MKTPAISVLMPVYNCALYLVEAVESILNQTFTDFELIILDDCSSDNSAEIAKSFTDKRIIYHCNETNLGLANNLNVGLHMAKGKYIARMDGDDISLPDRFQTQIDFLESHPDIDLCSCGLQMFGTENTIWVRESDPEAVKITMMFYSPVLHATSVWRKDSFEKHQLYYDQETFPAEDYDLWSRAIFYCRLVNIPQVLYKYRIHGIQVTKTDDRVHQRNKDIQTNYLKKALPALNDADISDFVNHFIGYDLNNGIQLKQLKLKYKKILLANRTNKFFSDKLLAKRLKYYYQSYVFKKLSETKKPELNLYFELRLKQMVKLILKKM